VDAVVVQINGIPAAIADFDTISLIFCVRFSIENDFFEKNVFLQKSSSKNRKCEILTKIDDDVHFLWRNRGPPQRPALFPFFVAQKTAFSVVLPNFF
jgi:hypothetical protein